MNKKIAAANYFPNFLKSSSLSLLPCVSHPMKRLRKIKVHFVLSTHVCLRKEAPNSFFLLSIEGRRRIFKATNTQEQKFCLNVIF